MRLTRRTHIKLMTPARTKRKTTTMTTLWRRSLSRWSAMRSCRLPSHIPPLRGSVFPRVCRGLRKSGRNLISSIWYVWFDGFLKNKFCFCLKREKDIENFLESSRSKFIGYTLGRWVCFMKLDCLFPVRRSDACLHLCCSDTDTVVGLPRPIHESIKTLKQVISTA